MQQSGPPPPDRLTAHDLTVAYDGVPAVVDVTLSLPAGCLCGLVGMNGAGKSTLLKALGGFVSPAAGSVRLDGLPPARAQRQQRLAYVPQSEQVDWDFPIRVRDVVLQGRYGRMNLLRWPAASDRRAVERALQRVDLSDLAERPIGALSGGQRKRVFLARALAQEATVLLLDEPFTGVDRPTERLIIAVLRELCAAGAAALLATHDLEAIPDFCDRVLLLNRRLLAFGPTGEVFTQANLLRTFGAAPVLP
ncbi:metal ABC transporter ATP-binding protein [Cyanobium sp. FGCU-6]|nr:metal ABC transporter ATP-binding protein [Cyanobium sp. FGCU6]